MTTFLTAFAITLLCIIFLKQIGEFVVFGTFFVAFGIYIVFLTIAWALVSLIKIIFD